MWFWVVLSVVLALVVIWTYSKLQSTRDQNDLFMQDMERRMKKIDELEKLLNTKNAELVAANKYAEQVNVAAWNKDKLVAELTNKVDELRQQLNETHLEENYDESIEKMKMLVAELDENYRVKNKNYAELEENYVHKVSELEQINVQIEQVKSCLLTGQNEAALLESEKERLMGLINDLNTEIETLKTFHHEAVLRENSSVSEGGWVFTCSAKESRLLTLVDELIDLYPELGKDLSGIAWKRVWLPKLQDLCNREGLDGKCGIYRIRLIEDESRCYIGQAVNIKDRWYTHVKKMVGFEAKGAEKLYEYSRPDEMRWEVVEEVGRDRLDERERYWIEWYGAKEVGLNKKV